MGRWGWLVLGATGCLGAEPLPMPAEQVLFHPQAGAIDGWVVQAADTDLRCPDGALARLVTVAPRGASGALPTAVLFHSGSFDFVPDPGPDPLAGPAHASPGRLGLPWAVRQVYATLGMHPTGVPGEVHTGALPAALAQAGVAMVLPTNCWGDLWHNAAGQAPNDLQADGFERTGRDLAQLAFQALTQPDALPFAVDPAARYAIGLGEGGRAVGELLHLDLLPTAIAVDSLVEDLDTLGAARPAAAPGLDRIFPAGALHAGALHTAPVLPPVAWIHSPIDPALPAGSQQAMLDRLDGAAHHLRLDGELPEHVLSNRDPDLAEAVVAFLTGSPHGSE